MFRLLPQFIVFVLFMLPWGRAQSDTLIILERSARSTFTQEVYQTLNASILDSTVHIGFIDSFYSSLTTNEKNDAFPNHHKSVLLLAGIDESTPITRIISQGTSPGMFLEQHPDFFPAAQRIFTHILWSPKTGQLIPSDINLHDSIKHITQLFPTKSHLLLVGNYNSFSDYLTDRLLHQQANQPQTKLIKTDYTQAFLEDVTDSTASLSFKNTVALVTHAPISQSEIEAFKWLQANQIPVLFLFGNEFDLREYKNVGGLVVSPSKLSSLIQKLIHNEPITESDKQVTVALYHNDAIEQFSLNPDAFNDDFQIIGRKVYSYDDIQFLIFAALIVSILFLCSLVIIGMKNRTLLNERAQIAEQANREKDQLMANISHELRTPLNAIYLAFNALTETPASQSGKIIDAGQRATEHLKNTVNTILDYQKSSSNETAVSLNWVHKDDLNQAINIHQYHAREKALAFHINGLDALPNFVKTDEKLLLQILHNVLSNALKFTEQGHVTVTFSHAQSQLHIEVVDTGIGMDKEALACVFVPFKQADANNDKKYQGTGLGMPLCKTLTTLLAGDITIHSQLGHGTRIQLSFPVEWHNTRQETKSDNPFCEYLPLSVLLVEDDELNRELFSHILQNRVHKLLIAASAQDALTVTKGFEFDVILTDIRMPEMDGVALFKALRKRSPHTPIIAVTGNASSKETAHYKALGFNDVIAKPFEVQDIMQALQMIQTASLEEG